MTISTRLASLDDIPRIQALITESVRALSVNYYSEQQINSALSYIFGVDTQLILDGTYFVAEETGQIVGAGGWSKRATLFGGDQFKAEQPDPLLDPAKDPARIRAFYVHPQWARKGVGRQILTACEDAVGKAGFTRIELMATLPGEPLYAALGYNRIEPAEMKMPDGQSLSGFRMEKHLGSRQ
jgi:GNAT superfamily N-acetyltransferase